MNEWTLFNVDNVGSSLPSQGLILRSLHLWYALMWLRDAVDSYALVLDLTDVTEWYSSSQKAVL